MKPLTEQTPVEIDTQLARIYDDINVARAEVDRVGGILDSYRHGVAQRAAGDRGYFGYTDDGLAQLTAKHALVLAELNNQRDRARPFNAEYVRRGRWTRAFLVRNAGGHVHSSMDCDTCFPTTVFAWLPEYSGHDTAEIIDAAGWRACSRCFPGAPTDNRRGFPTRIEDPKTVAARVQREAKAAEKAAKTAVTGISSPDGTPLVVPRWSGRGEELRTERAAEIYAVRILNIQLAYASFGKPEPLADHDAEAVERIIAALAAKRGLTSDEVRDTITKKAEAKHRRERR